MSHRRTVKKVKQKQTKPTCLLEHRGHGAVVPHRVSKTPCQKCVSRQREHTGGSRTGKYTGKVCQLGPVQFGKVTFACSPGFFLPASLINANESRVCCDAEHL